jgi:hypothetical protein
MKMYIDYSRSWARSISDSAVTCAGLEVSDEPT